MEIYLVKEEDLKELSIMIQKTCKISFNNFYPKDWIDYTISRQTVERLRVKAKNLHFYVAKEVNKIVACGAIGDYYGKLDESCMFSFFVDPEFQGKGYGRKIIQTLENDEYFLRAKRIEIPASIVALPFYRKMGYEFKNGVMIFDDGHFALEKFNPNYTENTL